MSVLAIDAGTTGVTALVIRPDGTVAGRGYQEFRQYYPQPGWVEHLPEGIWQATLAACAMATERAGAGAAGPADADAVTCIGITNQRETAVIWDRATLTAPRRAIVWQDRRSAGLCQRLRDAGHEPRITELTGLRLDPYFTGTKLTWLAENDAELWSGVEDGSLAVGTVDSYLIARMSGGRRHVTDASNASRTLLFDISAGQWSAELCELLRVPPHALPEVVPSWGAEGHTDPMAFLGLSVPVAGIAGDQQAALFGQACFAAGDTKCTYGTGAFLVLNTGKRILRSANRLLSTIAYQLGGEVTYALEGSILSAGSTIQWLRDGLGLFSRTSEVESLARTVEGTGGVYLVPGFTGLGAPYWDPDARGSIVGLSRASGRAELARAGIDCVVYQTRDLLDAMAADGLKPALLKVDGGMAQNGLFLQRLADILGLRILRPKMAESTAFGAACLAAIGHGVYRSLQEIAALWKPDLQCEPVLEASLQQQQIAGWHEAVRRTRTYQA